MPRINFADTQEGWIFCGYRILLYKWERCRVLMNPDDATEVAKLGKMEVKLQDEWSYDMSRDNRNKNNAVTRADFDIVAQTSGDRYSGPMIGGRFQVMESFIKGSYYLADHNRDDLIHRIAGPASDTMRFPTIEAAETFVNNLFTGSGTPAISAPSRGRQPPSKPKDTAMSLDITSENELMKGDTTPPLATIPVVSEPATVPWKEPVTKPKARKAAPAADKPVVEAKKPRVVKETVKPAAPAKAPKKPAPIKVTKAPEPSAKFKAVVKKAIANAATKPAPAKKAAAPVKAAPVKTTKVALPGLSAKSLAKAAPAKPVKAAAKPVKVVKTAPVKAPAKVVKPASGEPKKIGRPMTTGTISALARDLILKGKMTDAQIVAKAQEKFPDAKVARNLAAVMRGKLVKAGVAVPPRKV